MQVLLFVYDEQITYTSNQIQRKIINRPQTTVLNNSYFIALQILKYWQLSFLCSCLRFPAWNGWKHLPSITSCLQLPPLNHGAEPSTRDEPKPPMSVLWGALLHTQHPGSSCRRPHDQLTRTPEWCGQTGLPWEAGAQPQEVFCPERRESHRAEPTRVVQEPGEVHSCWGGDWEGCTVQLRKTRVCFINCKVAHSDI